MQDIEQGARERKRLLVPNHFHGVQIQRQSADVIFLF